MKTPKLKFIPIWIVTGWQTEIKTGIGCLFDEIKDNLITRQNMWLVYLEDEKNPSLCYNGDVFTNIDLAMKKLEKEKRGYMEYLQGQVDKCSEKLKELL